MSGLGPTRHKHCALRRTARLVGTQMTERQPSQEICSPTFYEWTHAEADYINNLPNELLLFIWAQLDTLFDLFIFGQVRSEQNMLVNTS